MSAMAFSSMSETYWFWPYPKTETAIQKYARTLLKMKSNTAIWPVLDFPLITGFRRIYGVVFRTSLHGEAIAHLRISFATISFNSSFCEAFVFAVDCYFNYRNYNQQKCDKCHLIIYWELSDRSCHKPCYIWKTCNKQGTYKWKKLFR